MLTVAELEKFREVRGSNPIINIYFLKISGPLSPT